MLVRPAARRLSEVDATGEFPHDNKIDVRDDLGPERRGSSQRGNHAHRPQICEEFELFPDLK
jgi:hypothetical protein